MQAAKLGMETLTNHLTVPHDHGPDQRIGAHPTAPTLGQLQRPSQLGPVRGCQLGIHVTD